ncbi:hypothetical protein PZA11_001966 [Diplocarpon coronariae]
MAFTSSPGPSTDEINAALEVCETSHQPRYNCVRVVLPSELYADHSFGESSSGSGSDPHLQPPYQVHHVGPYSHPSFQPRARMAPAIVAPAQLGPHPSYINVAQVYLFQQQLQGRLVAIGANPTREDTFRLQGVQWINDVRTALQLPVRTFCTASHYYHKFRLAHKDNEYQYHDAAAAALLTACKIEDTLKKSREILCAAHNLAKSPADHLNPDDSVSSCSRISGADAYIPPPPPPQTFETPSKIVIGLERLMLEASGFDFRVRYPHKHIIKLGKEARIEKDVARVAYNMMLDLYRTFAPLKQSCSTMAFSCIELATLLLERQQTAIRGERSPKYRKWGTTRTEIIETILDLLDLYTHFQKSSIVGPEHNREKFIQLSIHINREMEESSLKRYTEDQEARRVSGLRTNIKTPKTPATPASPADTRINGLDVASPATLSPKSSGSGKRGIGSRGQDGTVRFMLDSDQAKKEKGVVADYFKTEYEEYEIEVEEPIEPIEPERKERKERPRYEGPRNNGYGRGGGYERGGGGYERGGGGYERGGGGYERGGYYYNKRARR